MNFLDADVEETERFLLNVFHRPLLVFAFPFFSSFFVCFFLEGTSISLSTGFYWVLVRLAGFYWGFTGFYWVLLGFTGFYWVLVSFTGFYWVLLGFLGFSGFYWVLLGFTGF